MPARMPSFRGVIRMTPGRAAQPKQQASGANGGGFGVAASGTELIDLQRRRDQLNARVAELQWDLGGLVYEMAIRDRIRIDVIVRRAAELQSVDAELSEVERILRLEETSTAGECESCGAPHSGRRRTAGSAASRCSSRFTATRSAR